MRHSILIVLLLISLGLTLPAQERVAFRQWLIKGPNSVTLPVFSQTKDTENRAYDLSTLFASLQHSEREISADGWREISATADGVSFDKASGHQEYLFKAYLNLERWTKGTLFLNTSGLCEVLVDRRSVFSRKKHSESEEQIPLTLDRGNHLILIRVLLSDRTNVLKAAFLADKDFADAAPRLGIDPKRFLTVNDILDGKHIASASLSPSGRYLMLHYRDHVSGSGKDRGFRSILDLKTHQTVALFRGGEMRNSQWLPRSDRLSYTVTHEGTQSIWIRDIKSGEEREIAQGISNLSDYTFAPSEDRIVFSRYHEAEKPGKLKRIYGVEDRLPYFRSRSTLHLLDVGSGSIKPLTAGNLSADLHDISSDGQCILFSTSRVDYTEVPFRKQDLYEMNLDKMSLKTIWKDKLFGGMAQYSPDGKQLLVSGGPECFGEIGVNVSEGRIPNSYDGQIYLLDLNTGKVKALSRNFDPSVDRAHWSADGRIYLSVTERDFARLYRYKPGNDRFEMLPLSVEVLERIDFDRYGKTAVYTGTGVNMPEKLYLLDLKTVKSRLIDFPERKRYDSIRFGITENWDFVNKNGDTISGRVYYPVDYQEGIRYPLIVNYYGGTSPVERSFGGRYPIETWAAAGYMVYVLQPSGATGFGQDFSALHVNGWGYDAIDDIIDGTRAFLKAHPMADAKNVGCIGASYGGYTTMLLQTRTDLFKTAISHAGISSITSYWGEGYWGYSYNTGAARGSYPWNRQDMFVKNSPIYNADKFRNSILLLHGTDDTNVPVGESLQYYAALKLLAKDVEMVLVEGQNHHILDYEKRIKWHETIMSWFDSRLKNQPQQWQELYPDKNY